MTSNLESRAAGVELCRSPENQLLNKLLALKSADHLPDALNTISVQANQSLFKQGDLVEYVYFPLDAVVSRLGMTDDGTTVETAMVGCEGLLGVAALLGSSVYDQWGSVTIGGTAVRVNAQLLDRLLLQDETALMLLLGYYRSLIAQLSQRCICNTKHSLLERLSCWLLMIHDRAGSDNLRLTQEMMASRVSARRAGITGAAGVLQQRGAIESRRGILHVLDRQALEEVVCECYSIMRGKHWQSSRV